MAYITIADSEIDPESPGTTTVFTKLRDNPIEMMAKASGAPVLANDYIVTAMITDESVTPAKLPNFTAGDFIIDFNSYLTGASEVTITAAKFNEIKVNRAGTIRCKYRVTGTDIYFTLRINGTAVDTARIPADSGTLFSTDETVSAGDLIQIYVNRGSGTGQATVNLAICCNSPPPSGINFNYKNAL